MKRYLITFAAAVIAFNSAYAVAGGYGDGFGDTASDARKDAIHAAADVVKSRGEGVLD